MGVDLAVAGRGVKVGRMGRRMRSILVMMRVGMRWEKGRGSGKGCREGVMMGRGSEEWRFR